MKKFPSPIPSSARLLLLAWILSISGLALWLGPLAQAQETDMPCIPPTFAPLRQILLVPKIEQAQTTVTPRTFYTSPVFSINLLGDERICLASSPDGRMPLKIDDWMDLQITHADSSSASWERDFFNPEDAGITTARAQDISNLFVVGSNSIQVLLEDLRPQRYSAETTWLVIWKDPSARPIATPGSFNTLAAIPTGSPV